MRGRHPTNNAPRNVAKASLAMLSHQPATPLSQISVLLSANVREHDWKCRKRLNFSRLKKAVDEWRLLQLWGAIPKKPSFQDRPKVAYANYAKKFNIAG